MQGLNEAYFSGNIGHDPELRATTTGKSFLRLSLAVPGTRKVDGAWVDTPTWLTLKLWEKNAEYLARYARKGDALTVKCFVQPNTWTDRNGTKHYDVDLVVVWLRLDRKQDRRMSEDGVPEEYRGGAYIPDRELPPPPTDADYLEPFKEDEK